MRLVHYFSKDEGRPIDFIEMTERADFQEAVAELRAKWEIDVDYISENTKDSQDAWISLLENTRLGSDVSKMLEKLDITKNWNEVVHQFVVDGDHYSYNSKETAITRDSDGLILGIDVDSNKTTLNVGDNTTFEDMKNAWSKIVEYRKKPERRRNRKNFLRDYAIYRMAKDGFTISKIHTSILTEYKENLDYGHIKKVVNEFYNRTKTPKNERPELKM